MKAGITAAEGAIRSVQLSMVSAVDGFTRTPKVNISHANNVGKGREELILYTLPDPIKFGQENLVRTVWFRQQIESILNR
ncbi:hypothetical protein GCM10028819_01840 [Spirosoma humi]